MHLTLSVYLLVFLFELLLELDNSFLIKRASVSVGLNALVDGLLERLARLHELLQSLFFAH